MSSMNGGAPPTVRGLLEQEAMRPMLPPPVPPKEPLSPRETFQPGENEKFDPNMRFEQRMPDNAPDNNRSFSSDEASSDVSDALVVISTKDIMAMDGVNAGMAGMQLQRRHPGTVQRSLAPPGVTAGSPQPPMVTELSSSANSLSGSPRSMYPYTQAPAGSKSAQPGMYGSSPRNVTRLAPDRYGKDIPMDAPWTRIRRSLVSPEALERAGVRYEARPDYVAILGRLSREQIEAFARQSAECRAARSGRSHPQRQANVPPRRADPYNPRQHYASPGTHQQHNGAPLDGRHRADSKSSREDDDHSSDSVLWDENDSTDYDDDKTSEKGTKSYPYIVSPPTKEATTARQKTSPASTVMPKPILKNKNENHVRFDPEPYEVDPRKSPPSGSSYSSDEDRDRRRDQRRRRQGEDRHRHSGRRDYDRDRDRRRDRERGHRKKGWGDALGAVGIGGAAASLLGVLAQAAVGI